MLSPLRTLLWSVLHCVGTVSEGNRSAVADGHQPDETPSEPLIDDCDQHGRFVADGEFVVSRGNGPMPLKPVDTAFDRVPLFVASLSNAGGRPPREPRFSRLRTRSAGTGIVALWTVAQIHDHRLRLAKAIPGGAAVHLVGAGPAPT